MRCGGSRSAGETAELIDQRASARDGSTIETWLDHRKPSGFTKTFDDGEAGRTETVGFSEPFLPLNEWNQLADIVGRTVLGMERAVVNQNRTKETEDCGRREVIQVWSQTLDRHGDQEESSGRMMDSVFPDSLCPTR